jgi:hypothetical protein
MTTRARAGLTMKQRQPKATVRPMPDGSGWYVEVVWPNGRVERVDRFGSVSTARDWICRELPSYFKD